MYDSLSRTGKLVKLADRGSSPPAVEEYAARKSRGTKSGMFEEDMERGKFRVVSVRVEAIMCVQSRDLACVASQLPDEEESDELRH